jgi:hypothetical protein
MTHERNWASGATERSFKITAGNLRNNHIYLGKHRDFFPPDCIAFVSAQIALFLDSNDAEHDALRALVYMLDTVIQIEWGNYARDWLIEDFRRWARESEGDDPLDYCDVDAYVVEGRPRDSNPLLVGEVLQDWLDSRDEAEADPCMEVPRDQ